MMESLNGFIIKSCQPRKFHSNFFLFFRMYVYERVLNLKSGIIKTDSMPKTERERKEKLYTNWNINVRFQIKYDNILNQDANLNFLFV